MSPSNELAGKVALITGGARNIGRELSCMFTAAGANVLVNSRSARPELADTVEQANQSGAASQGRAMACVADITLAADAARVVQSALDQFGRIDILINNAVVHANKPFMQLTFDDWRSTLSVALDGAFRMTQACVPHIAGAGGGSIINMGGLFGHMPSAGRAATAAAKAGLAGFTRALAVELAPQNINVNYVSPAPANTERDEPFSFDLKRIPMGRLAQTSEVAAMVQFLCSKHGRYITGQGIHINGGLFLNS